MSAVRGMTVDKSSRRQAPAAGFYVAFDEPFTAEAETAIQAFLAANPKGKPGRHEYSLEELGLSVAGVREQFRDYAERYAIPTKS